jgi:hypothetical protein
LPLEVGISERATKIEFAQKQQRFDIAVDREPSAVTLDPNVWLLMDAKIEKR